MSWSWGALIIRLHGVPNCSSRQSGPPLWILPVHVMHLLKALHCSLSPNGYFTPPSAPYLPPPPTPPTPIESIRDITGAEKNNQKTSSIQVAYRNSYKMLAV